MLAIAVLVALAGATPYDVAPQRAPAPIVARTPVALAGPHTIFVNFDGVTLEASSWSDDATKNQTVFPEYAGEWPPFGDAPGSALRSAVLAGVRADFDAFGVEVTDTRPASGLYTMVVVSPQGAGGQTLGISNVACGGENLAGIAFAFFSASGGEAEKIASTISHEAAHSLGLDHVVDTSDAMYPTYQGGDPSFVDTCVALQPDAICGDFHAQFCPSGQQNSVAELSALLGTGEVDHDGPSLEIVEPADGDRFDLGDAVAVEVDATDDTGIEQIKLYRGDELVGTDIEAPYEWSLAHLEEGVVELHAIGIDAAGNEAMSDVVTIAIGDATLPDDGGSSSDDGAITSIDGGETPEDPHRDEGCGCSSTNENGGRGLAVPLACLALRIVARSRRRRSAASSL